jgi:hypothetical protein
MTDKVDLKKTVDGYRPCSAVFRIVELPTQRYLAVDGHGDPNTRPTRTRSRRCTRSPTP